MSSSRAALRLPDFRRLLIVAALTTLASKSLQVVIGFQVYDITHDQMSLGWLGLVEAIPALSLVLFGGHFADRHDRRTIILITMTVALLCSIALALLALEPAAFGLTALYTVVFLVGVARGFAEPAVAAFEAQVVPREHYVGAAALQSSVWLGCAIIGPLIGGVVFGYFGATAAYAMDAVFFAGAIVAVIGITKRPVAPPAEGESIFRSIALGVRYVFNDQVLVGSMALDLFAVLFGGAIALLPVFAKDILEVGPGGLGLLNAAPYAGACVVMVWSTRYPPVRHAGMNLLVSVAGFGVSIIVFAFSTNFWLSMIALFLSGAFDGVSMVIRKSIVRAMAPAHMRGRVAAVSSVFIGASNELGAFESGFAAKFLGTVRSVWLGGVVTLLVVAGATALAPRLRRLNLMTAQPVE